MRNGNSQENLVAGLIFATQYSENGSQLTSLIRVGGISVLERQLRLMSKTGIEPVVVIYPEDDASVPDAVAERSRGRGEDRCSAGGRVPAGARLAGA